MVEVKIERMVGGDAIEGVELAHLIRGDELEGEGADVEFNLPEIDIDSLDDAIE